MNNATRAALIEYLALNDKASKLKEILIEEMTLDELIHAGMFAESVFKYRKIVECDLLLARNTMAARREVICS